MQAGTRVRFSELFLKQVSRRSAYLRYEDWIGTVIKTSGKNEFLTHVKWDDKKTIQKYYCTFLIRLTNTDK